MYENTEGEFAYSVRTHRLSGGKVNYEWEVRHLPSGRVIESGASPRSFDAGKTAALETIFEAQRSAASAKPKTPPPPDDQAQQLALAAEEEHVLRCLGGAVIMHWTSLPTAIQRELFDLASAMGDPRRTAELKARIARFVHKHKDAPA